jgi:hypothetical protein
VKLIVVLGVQVDGKRSDGKCRDESRDRRYRDAVLHAFVTSWIV